MRAASPASLLAVLAVCGVGLLTGCGKGAGSSSPAAGGPTRKVAPVTAEGAVSLVTRNTTRLGGTDAATDAAAIARAVYPGLTPATRPELVILVDERDWPAALGASELAAAPLGAPILYSEGATLPAVSREALEALHPSGASSLGETQVLRIGTTAPVPKRYVTQSLPSVAAPAMAAALEHLAFGAGGPPRHQVIVVPANAEHALQMPAAGLAAEGGAPMLFLTPGGVPAATHTVLASLHRPSIYVLDAADVDATTLRGLHRLGPVSKIGATPAQERSSASANAIAVARFTDGQFGWGVKEPGHGLVFASETRPLDAPAAALLSATANYGPLLLLEGAHQVPPGLAAYLGDIQPAYTEAFNFRPVRGVYNHGWLIGDQRAISAVTQAEIDSLLEISPRKQTSEEAPASQVE